MCKIELQSYQAEEIFYRLHHQPRSSERLLNKAAAAATAAAVEWGAGEKEGERDREGGGKEGGRGRSRDRSLRFRVDSFNL